MGSVTYQNLYLWECSPMGMLTYGNAYLCDSESLPMELLTYGTRNLYLIFFAYGVAYLAVGYL